MSHAPLESRERRTSWCRAACGWHCNRPSPSLRCRTTPEPSASWGESSRWWCRCGPSSWMWREAAMMPTLALTMQWRRVRWTAQAGSAAAPEGRTAGRTTARSWRWRRAFAGPGGQRRTRCEPAGWSSSLSPDLPPEGRTPTRHWGSGSWRADRWVWGHTSAGPPGSPCCPPLKQREKDK